MPTAEEGGGNLPDSAVDPNPAGFLTSTRSNVPFALTLIGLVVVALLVASNGAALPGNADLRKMLANQEATIKSLGANFVWPDFHGVQNHLNYQKAGLFSIPIFHFSTMAEMAQILANQPIVRGHMKFLGAIHKGRPAENGFFEKGFHIKKINHN